MSLVKVAGKKIRDAVRSLLYFPDAEIGWYPFALTAARKLLRSWPADLILVSAGPQTGLLVGAKLSAEFSVPWVAELRDLWVDNHRYQHGRLRKKLESALERRTLSTAVGLITVSEPLAATLRAKYPAPVAVVYNGFDPADHALPDGRPEHPGLRVVYTGWVYDEHDPEPFFEALALLGDDARNVRAEFYRSDAQRLTALARRHGVEGCLEILPEVSFLESQRVQREADVLLYLSWNDPSVDGIFSGKLMQYFGARRPILAVGPTANAPAEVIRSRGLGVTHHAAVDIARQLGAWLREKRAGGVLPDVPADRAAEFSREEQTRGLEEFLSGVVAR